MKLIVELTNKNLIKNYKNINHVNYLVIGCKNLSLNASVCFNLSEIDEIYNLVKDTNLRLILNCERLFSDNDLEYVKTLFDLGFFYKFEYIMYSDFGLKNLLETLDKSLKFIFKASTYLTNKYDVNLYNKLNDFVVLSSEISSSELIELSKGVDKNVIVDVFGQSACFYSRRPLISNYFKYRGINKDLSNNYHVIEELRSDLLPIIENETGTLILEPKHHVLIEEFKFLENIAYGLISLHNLSMKKCLCVVKTYSDFIGDLNISKVYETFKDNNIEVYKGAYNIKSVLLKGGCNE